MKREKKLSNYKMWENYKYAEPWRKVSKKKKQNKCKV